MRILSLIVFLSTQALALQPYFPSSVAQLSIGNSHQLSEKIYRGSAPGSKVSELVDLGITDVLIFKNQTKSEVNDEVALLKENGIHSIKVIDMPWKNITSFEEACEKTLEGLRFLARVESQTGRTAFFHCTVGEDRTGLLAGLYRMLSQGWSMKRAFSEEMCARGFEAGNPDKIERVSTEVRKNLTPLFLRIAYFIENGEITLKKISSKVCQDDLTNNEVYSSRIKVKNYTCK